MLAHFACFMLCVHMQVWEVSSISLELETVAVDLADGGKVFRITSLVAPVFDHLHVLQSD